MLIAVSFVGIDFVVVVVAVTLLISLCDVVGSSNVLAGLR